MLPRSMTLSDLWPEFQGHNIFTSPSIGENANLDCSIFLEIVNCDFAQIFTIDSTDRHGCRIKISRVGNSCNLKKLGQKKFDFFSDFLENGVEFLCCVCIVSRRSRGSTEWQKKSGISLKFFRQRAPNVFIRVFLKVRWRFLRDCRGTTCADW